MKGILLAGGYGTRLYPVTKSISKHLLPVYDKPLIYYPLSVLMLAGIRMKSDYIYWTGYSALPGTAGKREPTGLKFSYSIQEKPGGLAEAFLVGEHFIGGTKSRLCSAIISFMGSTFRFTEKGRREIKRGCNSFRVLMWRITLVTNLVDSYNNNVHQRSIRWTIIKNGAIRLTDCH